MPWGTDVSEGYGRIKYSTAVSRGVGSVVSLFPFTPDSTVIGVVEVLAKDTILTDEAKAWALVVVGMLTVVLRALTTTAIGKGEE
jgi:hypothetical protein